LPYTAEYQAEIVKSIVTLTLALLKKVKVKVEVKSFSTSTLASTSSVESGEPQLMITDWRLMNCVEK
jgi:hypothetical protein